MPGINYYDGSSFQTVSTIEDGQGNQRDAYRWDGAQWVRIWPAIPEGVVDNLEAADGDPAGPYEGGETIADYYNGDTGSFERSQTGVVEGSWSLRWTGTAADEIWSLPGDGHPAYPGNDETSKVLLRDVDSGNDGWNPWHLRVSESMGASLDGYGVRLRDPNGGMTLWRLDNGSPTKLSSSNNTGTYGEWYWIEISPPASGGGSVSATRYNVDESDLSRGSEIDTVSASDDTYTDCTGIGWRSSSSDADATLGDLVEIVP